VHGSESTRLLLPVLIGLWVLLHVKPLCGLQWQYTSSVRHSSIARLRGEDRLKTTVSLLSYRVEFGVGFAGSQVRVRDTVYVTRALDGKGRCSSVIGCAFVFSIAPQAPDMKMCIVVNFFFHKAVYSALVADTIML
jgi:hypothetical protein